MRSQVMSPEAQTPLIITLSGYHNFHSWSKSLMQRAILYSAEWSYFLKNGSLVGLYKETEVSAEILELATLMLEEATLQLILKSCEVSIAKEIKRTTEN